MLLLLKLLVKTLVCSLIFSLVFFDDQGNFELSRRLASFMVELRSIPNLRDILFILRALFERKFGIADLKEPAQVFE